MIFVRHHKKELELVKSTESTGDFKEMWQKLQMLDAFSFRMSLYINEPLIWITHATLYVFREKVLAMEAKKASEEQGLLSINMTNSLYTGYPQRQYNNVHNIVPLPKNHNKNIFKHVKCKYGYSYDSTAEYTLNAMIEINQHWRCTVRPKMNCRRVKFWSFLTFKLVDKTIAKNNYNLNQ